MEFEVTSFGAVLVKCNIDNLDKALDRMQPLDVLHCPDKSAPIEFANWLRKNQKRGASLNVLLQADARTSGSHPNERK